MKLKAVSKLSAIHEELRQEILTGHWKTGDKLPTEAELAARFGCAVGTMSKAVALLAHDGYVKRRTRSGTHVIYQAQTGTIGKLDSYAFIYPSAQHEGIWRTVKGFQDAAREQQRRVVMLTTGADYRREAEFIGRLSEFDVRGAVVYPILETAHDQVHFSQMLMASKFPVVLVEVNILGLGHPAIVVDGFHAGYTMTKHLIDGGCQRIGFLSNYAWVPSMRDRYLGYRWALEESDLPEVTQAVLLEASMHADFSNSLEDPTNLGRAYLEKVGASVDGVVCADDFLAQGLILAAEQNGLKVPMDLKITGINDYGASSKVSPALTTYRVPCEEMGRMAFDQLQAIQSGNASPAAEMQVRGSLMVRDSSRCLR